MANAKAKGKRRKTSPSSKAQAQGVREGFIIERRNEAQIEVWLDLFGKQASDNKTEILFFLSEKNSLQPKYKQQVTHIYI
jgi:hypothetical protein